MDRPRNDVFNCVRCAYCSVLFANLAELDNHECTATELPESMTPSAKARIERLFTAYAENSVKTN